MRYNTFKYDSTVLYQSSTSSLVADAKVYGSFKYGDGTLYGQAPMEGNMLWGFEVDWDNDLYFTGSNEAPYVQKLVIKRGRDRLFKSDGTGFEPVPPGTFMMELNNTDRRYDPYNTSSPLYPYVAPGKLIRIKMKFFDGSVNRTAGVYYGRITNIVTQGRDLVVMTGEDGLAELYDIQDLAYIGTTGGGVDYTPSISVWHRMTGISGSNLDITDRGYGFSFEWATDPDILDLYWDKDESLKKAIEDITEAFDARFYMAVDGTFYFRNRAYLAALTSQGTFTESTVLKDIVLPQPWDVVKNDVRLSVYPRGTILSAQELWRLTGVPAVAAGATMILWGITTYNGEEVPFDNVGSSNTFLANAAADGSGANLTANFSVTRTDYSRSFFYTITNNGGTTGYITSLILTAKPRITNKAFISKESTSSKALYGTRILRFDNRFTQNVELSEARAIFLKDAYDGIQAFPTVVIEGKTGASLWFQFGRTTANNEMDLFTKHTLYFPTLDISGEFWLVSVQHEWLYENGQAVRTIYKFEPVVDAGSY